MVDFTLRPTYARIRVRLWLGLARYVERRLRAAYDRLVDIEHAGCP